jgi:hypothetical protein
MSDMEKSLSVYCDASRQEIRMSDMEKSLSVYCDASRQEIRMSAYARFSRGSICFTEVKEALRALSSLRFRVSRCGSRSQDLELLPYRKEK